MKFAAFFGKVWLKTKSATKKVWALAKLHKVVSIASAATVVAGATCAIALPIALHNHEYSDKWTFDTESHWHEASCNHEDERSDVAPHTYTNSCDADCNVCGKTRSITHTYDNACDTTCNVCEKTRDEVHHVFFNVCDTDCNICGAIREVGAHVYDDTCDTVCNACGAEREITHTFDDACDTTCNVCDYERKTEHVYMPGYGDATHHWYQCIGCGHILNENLHTYDNECDNTCNNCGIEREIEHTYATAMYKNADKHWYECTICGDKKNEAAHSYTSDCDATCDICNAIRTVPDHVYDDDCDTDCNVCGGAREIEHAYEIKFTDDKHWYECEVCNVVKEEAFHIYSHSCDTTCNKCDYERTVDEHPYNDTYTTSASHHWFECYVCKERKDVAEHVYTSDCDATCNTCDYVRAVNPHVYDNACDTVCNVENCGNEREVAPHPYSTTYTYDDEKHWRVCEICENVDYVAAHEHDNACDTECNVCGRTRAVPDHVYDNACDTNCNVCDLTRTVPDHVYNNACDTDCNVCGLTRTVPDHVYNNACDTDCNVCGLTRTVPDHVYDNNCDTNCNVCDLTRTVPDHIYDNDCDTTCNECDGVRTIEHKYVLTKDAANHWNECSVCHNKVGEAEHNYDNACDTTCNVCEYERTITHDYKAKNDAANHWVECSVCHDIKDEATHEYENTCDTTCNECDYEREITHTFASCEDTECSVCGYEREAMDHTYSGGCDRKCDVCGTERDSLPHEYATEYTIGETTHWYQCSGCDSKKDETEHSGMKWNNNYHWSECVCGYKLDDEEVHDYSNLTSEDGSSTHWYECVCGSIKDEAEHRWNFVYEKDADEHWNECIDCHYKKNEAAHNYPDVYETDGDNHWKTCTDCGYTTVESHNYPDEYQVAGGQHYKDCTICEYRNAENCEKILKHNDSTHWYECEVCNKEYDEENHSFLLEIEDEKYLKSEATATSEAAYYKVCRSCGQKGTDAHVWYKQKATPTIKIYVSDKTYNGKPLSFMAPYTTSNGEVEVWYKLNGEEEFVPYVAGAIVNAGEYVIKVTTKGTIEYYEGILEVTVTISKVTITLDWTIPTSIFDGTNKVASVTILSGVLDGEIVDVDLQLVSGDTTKPDQTIVYNALLTGQCAANYVIEPGKETVTYTIDPCAHVERSDLGFCTLCDVYPDTFVQTGVDADGNPEGYYMYTKEFGSCVKFEEIDPSTTTVYCRFKLGDNGVYKRTELEFYLCDNDLPDYEYNFDNYRAYVGDEDGNIVAEITDDLALWSNAFITLGDNYIYFVITLDGSLTQLSFGVAYYSNLN